MIPYYQVSAFSTSIAGGNPAGVCLLTRWPDDKLLQAIARENDLSETAFLVPSGDDDDNATATSWHLRWFTPACEVKLCGHATLASAHVLWRERGATADHLSFETLSGRLGVRRDGNRLALDFPARPAQPSSLPESLRAALGAHLPDPLWTGKASEDWLVVLPSEEAVRALQPDFRRLALAPARGVIVTARGADVDFVSRFFAPAVGVDEDPVTGSAHTTLVPYWAAELGRPELRARQVSARGGELWCLLQGDRVEIAGEAVTYMAGEIRVSG